MKSSYQLLQETLNNISMMDIVDIKIVNQMTSMIIESAKPKIQPKNEPPSDEYIRAAEEKIVAEIFKRLDNISSNITIETIRMVYAEIDRNMKSIGWNENTYPETNSCASGQKCLCLKWGGNGGTMWIEMEKFVLDPYPTFCKSCDYGGKEIKYINFQKYLDIYLNLPND